MKNKIVAFLTIALIVIAPSCKKTESEARDYSVLTEYSKPVILPEISDSVAQLLFDAVADIRTQFANQLESAYPGLNATMAADWHTIVGTADSATQRTLLQNFNNAYHDKVLLVWNNSGISISDITARYQNVLGNTAFTVGEFGQIVTSESATVTNYEPTYPRDSSMQFASSDWRQETQTCVLLGGSWALNEPDYTWVTLNSAFVGGCGVNAISGNSILLPDWVYKYVTASFKMGRINMVCQAGAFGGASFSRAKMFTNILDDFGNQWRSRDQIFISAVAPIIWFVEEKRNITAGTVMTISYHNEPVNTGITTTGGFHPCTRTDNGTISVGLGESFSSANVYKQETNVRMTR